MIEWPSTTQIIKHFGLMLDYGNPNLAAMQRGRYVAAACHLIAAGEPLGDGWEARHPECQPYLDAYRSFRREHVFILHEAEREYRCEAHRFVSHPDQIGMLDGQMVNLELKSGSMPRWCQLQTGGQVLAMGRPALYRYGLLLSVNGAYTLYPHGDFRDLDRFKAMVDTWWIWQEFRPKLEEGAIPS